ncbi:AAA family ATPase [Burkholderia multivorans]|uniref:AAA family ATPase n=1 Tax=Burkholderia multivorans TaxID=87883 RepID=UPI001C245B2F|nr:AAA family ATPase [Burkholderia multivorans]
MRLERFDKIRDYRIFKDFSWPRDLEGFGRYNLLYGWNGSGKTTLSNLFKALQAHSDIRGGQIDFIIGGNRVSGGTLSTSNALPQVRVFNHATVASSVFESSGGGGQFPVAACLCVRRRQRGKAGTTRRVEGQSSGACQT